MYKLKLNESGFWTIITFLFSLVYFSLWGQALIQYQNDQHLFLYSETYWQQFLNMPGGMVQWLSAFFTQFYYYYLLGAIVIALLITIVFLLSGIVLKQLKTPFKNSIALILCIVLTLLLQNYENTLLAVLAVIINLLFIISWLSVRRWGVRLILGLLSIVLSYYITGAFYWVYTIPVIAAELIVYRDIYRFINAVLLLITSLSVPYYLAIHYYYIFIEAAYLYPLQTKAYTLLPYVTALIAILLLSIISGKLIKGVKLEKSHRSYVVTFLILCLGVIIVCKNNNSKLNTILKVSYSGKHQQWSQVLNFVGESEVNNLLIPYYTNLALAHKGVLLDQLFCYSQKAGSKGLYFTWEKNQHLKEHGGLFFYTVGYVNEAHHWAFESLVQTGAVAPVLKDLVRYNLVLGKTSGARKYINVLKQSLFYHQWALKNEHLCDDTEKNDQLNWIQHKRSQIPSEDYFMDVKIYEKDLLNMVVSKPDNKMAVDYLAAYYLLSNQAQKLIDKLALIKQHYPVLPLAVQEACAVYAPEIVTDKKVLMRYKYYKESRRTTEIHNADKELIHSFWYYIDFVCPHDKN